MSGINWWAVTRQTFEKIAEILLSREFGTRGRAVNGSGGDDGIDYGKIIFQFKFFPDGVVQTLVPKDPDASEPAPVRPALSVGRIRTGLHLAERRLTLGGAEAGLARCPRVGALRRGRAAGEARALLAC